MTQVEEAAVRLEALTKDYASPAGVVRVLDQVDFEAPRGTTIALRGVSGSGKSTLLHLLGAIDSPSSGRVIVDGHDISAATRREQARFRARSIGFVFQFFNLMPTLTVAENVASGLEPLRLDRVRRDEAVSTALAKVELDDQADKYPAQLSGGQQQRVAIARALAGRPALVMADEPTGNLDSATGASILDLLRELHADGTTIVVITHDLNVAAAMDRRIEIRDGRILHDTRAGT